MILQEKGWTVIESDFLDYGPGHPIDFFIMNPPFSEGAKHLLHAWNVLESGDIACVLNAETLRNRHTKDRENLFALVEMYGSYEFIGQPFKNAERATNVECVVVWLHKEGEPPDFTMDDYERDGFASPDEFNANPLAHANIIQALVAQYDGAVRAQRELQYWISAREFYMKGINGSRYDGNLKDKPDIGEFNDTLFDLKRLFWGHIFEATGIGMRTTSGFQRDFETFRTQQELMAFSVKNVVSVLEMFLSNSEDYMKRCLLETFDAMTKYHAKNVVHHEGWKTNKSYRVNKKVILPDAISFDQRWGTWSTAWRKADIYLDIDKVMCWLTGRKIEKIVTAWDAIDRRVTYLNRNHGANYADEFESTFFYIRFYKKGTTHITFQDTMLHEEFNRRVALGKGWLGPGY
jgi:hypothetical protein